MKRILLLTFVIVLASSLAAQNPKECKKKCDCSHWPWTSKCKDCCGVSSGTVLSDKSGELKLRTNDGAVETFKLTPQTKVKGELKRGEQARVFYKISVNESLGTTDHVAATVTTDTHGSHSVQDEKKDREEPR